MLEDSGRQIRRLHSMNAETVVSATAIGLDGQLCGHPSPEEQSNPNPLAGA